MAVQTTGIEPSASCETAPRGEGLLDLRCRIWEQNDLSKRFSGGARPQIVKPLRIKNLELEAPPGFEPGIEVLQTLFRAVLLSEYADRRTFCSKVRGWK